MNQPGDKSKRTAESHNKKVLENHLTRILSKICKKLRIQLEEWDFDDVLYGIMKEHPDFALGGFDSAFAQYDSFYAVGRKLKLKLDPKFHKFYKIHRKE